MRLRLKTLRGHFSPLSGFEPQSLGKYFLCYILVLTDSKLFKITTLFIVDKQS